MHIQRSLPILSLAVLMASCGGKENTEGFQLKGNFSNSNGETIYLEKLAQSGLVKIDSTVVGEKGEFEFALENYKPKIGFYRLMVNTQSFATLVLDSADRTTVTGDIKDLTNTYKVEGSAETKLFLEYNNMEKRMNKRLDSLNEAVRVLMEPFKNDSLKLDSISRTLDKPYYGIVNPAADAMIAKIKQNSTRYASLAGIQSLEPDKYPDAYRVLDEGLAKKYPNDANVGLFHQMVQRVLSTGVGQMAPDIVLPSPDGKEIALSSFKGKVVLVDFWASWCSPCRKEMPNVVKAYAKFKGKGFEIYGVSLDQDKDRWVDAIAKDGITWPQVSELKQWESNVVQLYNIHGIPHTVLLDKDGRIIAKDLRGAALEKKLAEVLN